MAGLSRAPQGRQASFGQMWRMTNRLQRAAALAVGAAVGVVAELKAGQGIGQVHAAGMVAGTCLSRRRAPPRRGSKSVRSGTKSGREVLSGCHRGFFLADPELPSSWRTFVQGVRQSHHFLPDPPFLSAKSAPICCRPSGESSGLSWEKDRRRVVVQSGPSSGRKAGVKYRPSLPMATW